VVLIFAYMLIKVKVISNSKKDEIVKKKYDNFVVRFIKNKILGYNYKVDSEACATFLLDWHFFIFLLLCYKKLNP
jgi:anti-sigma28 factor (negative regulator of flagellin synthesis)